MTCTTKLRHLFRILIAKSLSAVDSHISYSCIPSAG